MLVLDRKLHQGFWIGGAIFVKVLGISKNRVKLGIEAPGDVEVLREELRHEQSVNNAPSATHEEGPELRGSVRAVRRRN